MPAKPKLELVTDTQEFFYELLSEAVKKQSYRPMPSTQVYLLNLLNQFVTTDALYARDAQGNFREEPLALMVKEAMETPALESQRLLYRQVGDVSLYVAGFFQDSLKSKIVDIDYYVSMGGAAYQNVARRADEALLRECFEELADRFALFVDILAEIADRTTLKSEKDLMRMYDLWTRTRSERAAKALREAGIIPAVGDPSKKTVQ